MATGTIGAVKWYGNKVMKEVKKQERIVLKEIGKRMSKSAKSKCPVGSVIREGGAKSWTGKKPGTLKKNIRYNVKGNTVRIVAGSYKVFYARFVERGTKFMPKKPFLRPALDEAIIYFNMIIAQKKLVK